MRTATGTEVLSSSLSTMQAPPQPLFHDVDSGAGALPPGGKLGGHKSPELMGMTSV